MKIETFGTISPEVTELAKQCEIPRYLVCGVDVYSYSLPGPKAEPKKTGSKPEIVDHHYRVIDLIETDDYLPCTTIADLIAELRTRISELTEDKLNFIKEKVDPLTGQNKPGEILEFDDDESIFKLTSLTREEMEELLKG